MHLYKLPWSQQDNPNGWIEPTTYCQLKCPGCYRGLDTWEVIFQHIPLDEMKQQVDDFIAKRNVQTISIAWGEPLMYPQIFDLVEYISSKKIFTKIYTNGISLTEKTLQRMKEVGLTEFVVHIDMFQDRQGWIGKTETELNILRQSFVDMFRKYPWINLGFIMPIGTNNLIYLDDIMKFYRTNIDIINLIVFTVFRDVHVDNLATIDAKMLAEEIAKRVEYEPSSYLPKVRRQDEYAWLLSVGFGNPSNYFGDVNAKQYQWFMEAYYKKWWKFFITKRHVLMKGLNLCKLFAGILFSKSGIKIIKNYLFSKEKDFYYQSILIIDPPSKFGDWCEACPDMMYVNGKMFPSCMVNKYKPFKDRFLKKKKDVSHS